MNILDGVALASRQDDGHGDEGGDEDDHAVDAADVVRLSLVVVAAACHMVFLVLDIASELRHYFGVLASSVAEDVESDADVA